MEVEIDSRLVIPLQGPTRTPRRCTHNAGACKDEISKNGSESPAGVKSAFKWRRVCLGAYPALLQLCPPPTELVSVAISSSGMRMHDLGKAARSLSSCCEL
jgi:hypothetical protein